MTIKIATTRQTAADAYKNIAASPWVALHTGAPGTNGTANQASGGAYARAQTTWTSGTGGVLNGSEVSITVPAGKYTHSSLWTAQSGGSCIDWAEIVETTVGGEVELRITPSFTLV